MFSASLVSMIYQTILRDREFEMASREPSYRVCKETGEVASLLFRLTDTLIANPSADFLTPGGFPMVISQEVEWSRLPVIGRITTNTTPAITSLTPTVGAIR